MINLTHCENRVAYFRQQKGLSQMELGMIVGVSKNTISSIELGDTMPRINVAIAIACVLEVDVDTLFYLILND